MAEIFRRSSDMCKNQCIDQGKTFCPFKDFDGGVCCPPDNKDCILNHGHDREMEGICSNQNPEAPLSFKYFTCPNEWQCGGSRDIVPAKNSGGGFSALGERDVRQTRERYKFRNGDLCSYLIKGPDDMVEGDKIHVQISEVANSQIWLSSVNSTSGYKNEKRDVQAVPGETTLVSLEHGHSLYVTAWGSDLDTNGFYRLETWVENAPEPVVVEEEVVIEEDPETNDDPDVITIEDPEKPPVDPPIIDEPEVIIEPNVNNTVILDDIPINEDAKIIQDEQLDNKMKEQVDYQSVLLLVGFIGLITMLVFSVLYIVVKVLYKRQEPPVDAEEFDEVKQEDGTGNTQDSIPNQQQDSERYPTGCATARGPAETKESNHLDLKLDIEDKLRSDSLATRKLTKLDLGRPKVIEDLEDCDKDITMSEYNEARQEPRMIMNNLRL